MDWPALARAVVAQRVALGYDSQKALAAASGIGLRTVTEIEAGRRDSYTASTLARLEKALQWPAGRVDAIVSGEASAEDPSWLSTPEGIARHLHRDDLPLVALLHRAGLTESDLFRLILKVRARREKQNAELLEEVATAIRDLGGWAPEQAYPPLWLAEEE